MPLDTSIGRWTTIPKSVKLPSTFIPVKISYPIIIKLMIHIIIMNGGYAVLTIRLACSDAISVLLTGFAIRSGTKISLL